MRIKRSLISQKTIDLDAEISTKKKLKSLRVLVFFCLKL
tara:strand:- start:2214 stop:2330 length:117 start_codon:yes stop_codon:yes gene_type:complete